MAALIVTLWTVTMSLRKSDDEFAEHISNINSAHSELQEKVRRCINQGFIDPEDFKGVCYQPYSFTYYD